MRSDYKLTGHLTRARKAGLPATLTQSQWASTLSYFKRKCAYCLTGNYHVIDHFVSIKKGGGTTVNNCVPACWSCNTCKDKPGLVLLGDPERAKAALERVRAYLDSLEKEPYGQH